MVLIFILLADKQILARILKYSVREFQDMEIEDIMSHIGENIEIGVRPVDPGLSSLGRVRELNAEDNIPGEGKIFYVMLIQSRRLDLKGKIFLGKAQAPAMWI